MLRKGTDDGIHDKLFWMAAERSGSFLIRIFMTTRF